MTVKCINCKHIKRAPASFHAIGAAICRKHQKFEGEYVFVRYERVCREFEQRERAE